ncbi:MAG: PorT family protein [Saprospiraceae bacterium]|nr:PorT family protein [Saprospiraceae bacterium]
MKKIVLFFCCFSMFHISMSGQIKFGLRAGMNMSKLLIPIEKSSTGDKLNSNEFVTGGVHVGILFKYELMENLSVNSELLYTQKGTRRTFEGDGFYIVNPKIANPLIIKGDKKSFVTISNSYLEVPLTINYKLGPVELGAGFYSGILLSSKGSGEINIIGKNPVSDRLLVLLNHNYLRDKTVGASEYSNIKKNKVNVAGSIIDYPYEQSAYHDFDQKDGNWYSALDFGFVGSLYYYFNKNFFAGARMNYGLKSIAKDQYLLSDAYLDGTKPQKLDGGVKNYNYQFTIGFTF